MESKTVIKLNNIPHGFYENQMRDYFSQFGAVKNVLLIRSKKTHKSRGFGFVEFHLPQVARAAAESMHNYLLFNNVLKCRQMNRNDLPKGFFLQTFKGINSVDKAKKIHNITRRDDKKIIQHYKKILAIQKKLKDMGVLFECHIINKPALVSGTSISPEKPTESPPKRTMTRSATKKKAKSPGKATKSPDKPVKSPQKPTKSPARKMKTLEKPIRSVAKPSRLPVKQKTPQKSLLKTAQKSPLRTPQKSPLKTPQTTPQKSPNTSLSKIPRRMTRSAMKKLRDKAQ